jgi:RNA polymerase sigma-70 factor (ECF subfamily)
LIYCIVPESLALELHDVLRAHFSEDPGVEVVVERRQVVDRRLDERRSQRSPMRKNTRRSGSAAGRRTAQRRAEPVEIAPPSGLPPAVEPHRSELRFLMQSETTQLPAEDADSSRLVAAFQAGDEDAFSGLYLRCFDRVYAYMRVVLEDAHAAEDATQQVFIKLFEALPRYQERGQPFRAFLFVVARNHAVTELRRRRRLETIDPIELDRYREPLIDAAAGAGLPWVSDRELLTFVERLPLAQRQVLLLRFMMDFSHAQIGEILGRTPEDVRALQYRALGFLRTRLNALRNPPECGVQRMQMQRRMSPAPVTRARKAALAG